MSIPEQQIVLDFANLSIILLGAGLVASMLWSVRRPVTELAALGKVKINAFDKPELATAVGLIFFFYAVVREPALRQYNNSVFILAVVLLFFGFVRNNDLVAVFGLTRMNRLAVLMWTLIYFVAILALAYLVNWIWIQWISGLVGQPDLQPRVRKLQENQSFSFRLQYFLSACLIAPVIEEMLFRGYLYPALKRFINPLTAAVVVSGIFGAVHYSLGSLLPLCVLSLLLVAAYEITGDLLVPILVHAAFNTFTFFWVVLVMN